MIDIRKLKELVRLMVENDLSELDLQDQQETVSIKRSMTGAPVVFPTIAAPAPVPAIAGADGAAGGAGAEGGADADEAEGLTAIESPMVGTLYTAPNPDSPPFVEVGKSIGPESTVCLIEAMKVFNEIKAEVSGTIERVLVQNGQAVEYGQKLFLVKT